MNLSLAEEELVRAAAVILADNYGSDFTSAVDDLLEGEQNHARAFDLGLVIAGAALLVASAQLFFQLKDRYKNEEELIEKVLARLKKAHPEELKLVTDPMPILIAVRDQLGEG